MDTVNKLYVYDVSIVGGYMIRGEGVLIEEKVLVVDFVWDERLLIVAALREEGRCKATWKREFKREAGPPNHHDDEVDSDQ